MAHFYAHVTLAGLLQAWCTTELTHRTGSVSMNTQQHTWKRYTMFRTSHLFTTKLGISFFLIGVALDGAPHDKRQRALQCVAGSWWRLAVAHLPSKSLQRICTLSLLLTLPITELVKTHCCGDHLVLEAEYQQLTQFTSKFWSSYSVY